MATLGNVLTYRDLLSGLKGDKTFDHEIVDIMVQQNDILDDMVWIEGNQTTGHKTTMRSGIPEPIFRKLYGGVQPTKSRTLQIIDNCGMLESYAEIDKARKTLK